MGWGVAVCEVLVAEALLFWWYPSRFLGAAAFDSLWTCVASFVDTWGLRLALAEWFPPFWWFVALGCDFIWGALGTFVSFASSRWALPWFALQLSGVWVSVWFFS